MRYLVVVDMQNDFVDGALGTAEAVSIAPAVIRKAEGFDGEVIFTRDTHFEDYLETQEGRNLPVVHCIRGSHGWELIPGLKEICEKRDCLIFDKLTFGSMELAAHFSLLCGQGKVESVEICGVCTDICVISDAILLKAAMPEIKITVDPECCAGTTPENHDNALKAMAMCQICRENA